MNLSLYDYTAVILLPLILINFCLDFLSDSEIVNNETKIGFFQLFHHIVCVVYLSSVVFMPFVTKKLSILIISVLVSFGIQLGYIVNNDYCWLTRMVNNMIDPSRPKRKWVGGDICSLVKKYMRDETWAYSDINYINNTKLVLIVNVVHIFFIVHRYLIFQ
jgi:hypothetical protein